MRKGMPPPTGELRPRSEWSKVPFESVAKRMLPKYDFAMKVLDAREAEYIRIVNGDTSGLPEEYRIGEIDIVKRAGDAIENIYSSRRRIGFCVGEIEEELETNPQELVTEGLGCSFYEQTRISFSPIEGRVDGYDAFEFSTGSLTGHLGGYGEFFEDDTLLQLSPEMKKRAQERGMQSVSKSLEPILKKHYEQLVADHGQMPQSVV
jgi:hypothetical protein